MSKLVSKIFTAFLAAAVAISMFAGCAKQDTKQSASTAPGTAAAQTKEEKKPTLKALQIWQKDDYNTYPVAKYLEERTGYHVEYEMLPQDKPDDKLNLIIASGEPYDVITTGGGSGNKALYSDYAKRGALVDLGTLLDKFGPNIKAVVYQDAFDAVKVDGKIFAVPTRATPSASTSLLMRQDWLEKVGMKTPETVDEFIQMLKAFKEKDPGGNGADKNIALTINGDAPTVPNLIGGFGMPNAWNDIGGKLVPRPLDPAFKDYLALMGDIYKQGLLDKEFATNKDAITKEKFTSGRAGVIPLNWADIPMILDALKKNKPEAKTVYLPALKGKDGKMGLGTSATLDRITFVPKSSKNQEHVVKWMNAKMEKDTFRTMAIGEEGKHYTMKDGAYFPILPIFVDERNAANNFLTGTDDKLYPIYWQARVRKDPRLFEAWEFMNIKQPAETRKLDVIGMAPYLPEYSKNNAQLMTMINDYIVKVIVGGEQLSNLDAFAQKFKTSGGDASIKEVNDWYPTYKK